jgi:hypothetical protein
MSNLFGRLWLAFEQGVARRAALGAERRRHEQAVTQAVERVVDQVNPRLRAVGAYRKRLFPVVEGALAHLNDLVQQVPGPIRVDRESWAQDPQVNSLFGSVKRMRTVLTGPEVRAYVKEHPLGGDCYAFLATLPDVRQQLGTELQGDSVRRDVRQTTVSFSEQEVALVGEDEKTVREALADAALELLVGLALQDITARESRIAELEERLRIRRLKRKVADAQSHGAAFLLDDKPRQLEELARLDADIAEMEEALAEAREGMETLDDYLEGLVSALAQPERLLGLEEQRVRLDRMNIVRDARDATTSELAFTRVRRLERLARVVTLIRFPRSELMDDSERLRDIERFLS